MKVYVYKGINGTIYFNDARTIPTKEYGLLGELDLDIKPEKKVVKKEIEVTKRLDIVGDEVLIRKFVPIKAMDIKITYEIEE